MCGVVDQCVWSSGSVCGVVGQCVCGVVDQCVWSSGSVCVE